MSWLGRVSAPAACEQSTSKKANDRVKQAILEANRIVMAESLAPSRRRRHALLDLGDLQPMTEQGFESEDLLQTLLARYPDLHGEPRTSTFYSPLA